MNVKINGGTVSGGLYALDTYAGSTSNIIGGKLFANANVGRTDEYGKSYAIHAKGEAVICRRSTFTRAISPTRYILWRRSTTIPTSSSV